MDNATISITDYIKVIGESALTSNKLRRILSYFDRNPISLDDFRQKYPTKKDFLAATRTPRCCPKISICGVGTHSLFLLTCKMERDGFWDN